MIDKVRMIVGINFFSNSGGAFSFLEKRNLKPMIRYLGIMVMIVKRPIKKYFVKIKGNYRTVIVPVMKYLIIFMDFLLSLFLELFDLVF